jgi:uncharacterized protein (UPF0332 family)
VTPESLLDTAQKLLDLSKRRPSQTDLKRSLSTCYYAFFHALARNCADTLIGSGGASQSNLAWTQVYRSLDHGFAKNACEEKTALVHFPQPVRNFAIAFVALQKKRHTADYDPNLRLTKRQVDSDIKSARQVIGDFEKSPTKDKRAFAAHVLLRRRPA